MLRLLIFVFAIVIPASAQADWWEARTDNFIVYSESSSGEAKKFAETLERFDMSLRSLQNIKLGAPLSDSQKLTVFRTGDMGDIGRLAGSPGVAGFYIPRHGGPVAFSPAEREIGRIGAANADRRNELDELTVLFHEYAHHFMFKYFTAAYPSWYVEGFAEAYSTIDLNDDGSFHLGNAPQARAAAFEGRLNYSVQRMLQTATRPGWEDVYGRYSYGWLLTHYLNFEPGRAGQLQKYLKLIGDGTEATAAAEQAFGDLRELERDVMRYINGELPGFDVRPANYRPPSVAIRKLAPDEEAIMRVRLRSAAGVTRKEAPDIAGDARAIAARFPGSIAVQRALAEAELDADNLGAAEAAADAALAIRPDAVEALILKGRIYLERGKDDPRHNETARIWLVKAHEADRDHPSVLYYNYLSYFQEGAAIPEAAIIGLERAYMGAPYDSDLRLVLARQLLGEKKGKLAHQVLGPLVHSPHESKSARALREVYDLIEAQKVGEAYAGLAAEMAKIEEERESGEGRD